MVFIVGFGNQTRKMGIYSVQQLMKIYEQSVGRNSNMLMGTVINPDGLVPERDAQRLAEFGKALKEEYANSLGNTSGEGKDFTIKMKKPASLKKYVLQEEIQFGERVQSYLIKGKSANGVWIEIDKGSCIGHKRIGQINHEEKFIQVALQILESKASPHIRRFEIY